MTSFASKVAISTAITKLYFVRIFQIESILFCSVGTVKYSKQACLKLENGYEEEGYENFLK